MSTDVNLQSILGWISFLQLWINQYNLIMDDGSEDLQALDVHLNLSFSLSLAPFLTKLIQGNSTKLSGTCYSCIYNTIQTKINTAMTYSSCFISLSATLSTLTVVQTPDLKGDIVVECLHV